MGLKSSRRWPIGFLVATTAAGVLYLSLRSVQWDLNGISEAQAIDEGGAELFSQNHLLYRPLGAVTVALARATGYGGHSAAVLQILTAILAGLGVGAAWSWFRNLTGDARAASLGALFLATSWSYWTFSTDAYYITPAAAAAAGALALLAAPPPRTRRSLLLAAALVASSVLLWQANIFLLPAVAGAMHANRGGSTRRDIWREIGLLCATAGAFVAIPYLAIGSWRFGLSNPRRIFDWLVSEGSLGTIQLWGTLSGARVPQAIASAFASLAADGALPIAALALLTLFVVAALRRRHAPAGWLLLGYAAYIPFIVWWDPFEPKWFVVPNLFLAALLAAGVNAWQKASGPLFAGLLVMALAAANFTTTVWPRHTRSNPNLELARCFSEHVSKADAVVVTDWNWFDYTTYFFRFEGRHVGLVGNAAWPERNAPSIRAAISESQALHGRVFVRDPASYDSGERAYFHSLTGFEESDLASFVRRDAFQCGAARFQELRLRAPSESGGAPTSP